MHVVKFIQVNIYKGKYLENLLDFLKKDDADSFFGNAIFSKYKIINSNVVVLKTFRPVTIDELDGVSGDIREQIPRHLLDAEVDYDGKVMHILSWHGAW